ncbi:MAG: peroxidase-related enzyme [Geodermatophilaceae bacterium]|nr:peroxidase-related enzyme [Geodermatophilaceae bacterium]MDQ3455734.1 peroxidase-related enzyme [Actinomycetota bacterium]
MVSEPISRFPVPDRADLPADLAERIAAVEDKSGFVPNVFLALAHRPAEWRAFFAYHDALMDAESALLGKAERELIVVATSALNHCLYCVVAHGAIARIRSRNPRLADQVAVDWRKAELTAAQRAMLEFATRLAAEPWTVTEDEHLALAEHGFTRDDVWDIGSIVAFFAMSNRLVHLAAVPPNEEFYLLGRLPKPPAESG